MYLKKFFSYTGRVSERLLFYILLVLLPVFAIAVVLHNFYASLVLLGIWLFSLRKRWSKFEFKWRFLTFLLTVFFLVMLFATSEIPHMYVSIVIISAGFSTPLLSKKYRWRISGVLGTEDVLTLAIVLMVLAISVFFSLMQLRDLIGMSGFFLTFSMLNYLSTALRRAELTEFLQKLGRFKTPEDFIEKILEKSIMLEDEKKDFIRYRFSEFLKYIEQGAFEQAYVTLATGTLELLGIWYGNIQKRTLKEWHICYKDDEGMVKEEKVQHDDIRGAIVHSTPKHKATEEEKKADLPKKKAILSKFRADPFTPIKDLLNAAAEEYRIKTPTKRKEYMVPQLSLIFKTANHTDIRLSWLQGLLKIKRE